MISRRNFLIIVIVMAVIFVMFQFSQIAKDSGNDYMHNDSLELSIPDNNEWKAVIKSTEDADKSEFSGNDYILFIGDKESNLGSIVTQWATYTKNKLLVSKSLEEYTLFGGKDPRFIIADSSFINFNKDLAGLKKFTADGVSTVFCTLPDNATINASEELREYLGISYIKEDSITVEGIKLFDGFLLGGETIYQPQKPAEEKRQDLNLTMPWYMTSGGTKTYMVGLMDEYFGDTESKNDFFPALIWRNSTDKGQVFCVAGDYMNTTAGLGILSSMIYELSNYQLYPVVNAQNTLLIDYPLLANENDEKINSTYSRSYDAFQKIVIWPSLIAIGEKDKMKYTCLMSPKFDYEDSAQPNHDDYSTYLNLFNERDCEVGYSLEHPDSVEVMDKIKTDEKFFESLESRYTFTSAFIKISDEDELSNIVGEKALSNVRTIACDADIQIPILSYLNKDIVLQSLTSNTKNFAYSKDLMLKSIETALGYDNAKLDFTDVVFPEDEMDEWQNIYDDMSSSLSTYWKPFRAFDRTTLSESDRRVRVFLNLYSTSEREDNEITLNIEGRGTDDCYYILRTHGEQIAKIEGATYTEIEEDAYLLTVSSDEVKISLEASKRR